MRQPGTIVFPNLFRFIGSRRRYFDDAPIRAKAGIFVLNAEIVEFIVVRRGRKQDVGGLLNELLEMTQRCGKIGGHDKAIAIVGIECARDPEWAGR